MKASVCAGLGALGSALASAFGGWTAGLTTLVIFMAADYATGLLAAGVFKVSPHSPGGGLESRAGWKGLIRKGMILLVVLVACRLDLLLGSSYIRDAAVIGFCVNELISLLENLALMGVYIPEPIRKALDVLKKKEDHDRHE